MKRNRPFVMEMYENEKYLIRVGIGPTKMKISTRNTLTESISLYLVNIDNE